MYMQLKAEDIGKELPSHVIWAKSDMIDSALEVDDGEE